MAGGPLKNNGVSIPLIVSDGKRIISDQKIATNLFRQNLVDVTAACLGPMVETKYFPALAKSALTGIGDLKQNDTDGWQYYVAILDRSSGKITKMGLPCVTTESGEKIFPSATDLKPEDLAGYAKNLPPGFEIAVVLRYDRGMTQDISINEGTSFASLSASNPSPVPQDVLASTKIFQSQAEQAKNKSPANMNEQKCVACGGDPNAKLEGPVAPKLKIFLGDQEMPVTLDGVSDLTPGNTWRRSADAMTDRFQQMPPFMPASLAASQQHLSGFSFQSPYPVREKSGDPFPQQIREVVLSCILFSVKSASQALVVGDPALMISQVRIPLPKGARADSRIMKGILSIMETDQCPSSKDPSMDAGRRIEFMGTPDRMNNIAKADGAKASRNKIDKGMARDDGLAKTARLAQPLHERPMLSGKARDVSFNPHANPHTYLKNMRASFLAAQEAAVLENRLKAKKRPSDRKAQRKSAAYAKKTSDSARAKRKRLEDEARSVRVRQAKDAKALQDRKAKKGIRPSNPPKAASHSGSAGHSRSRGIGKTDRSGSYWKTRPVKAGRRGLPDEKTIPAGHSIAKKSGSAISASWHHKPEIPKAPIAKRPSAHPKAGLSKPRQKSALSHAQITKGPGIRSVRIARNRKNVLDMVLGLFNEPKKRRRKKRRNF